jgi:iron complex outermembrane receptor protein
MPNRLPAVYPLGFDPKETMKETDYAFTAGIKGKLRWRLELGPSAPPTAAINQDRRRGLGNVSLYNDTGFTPTVFQAGEFIASQWTNNLDVSRDFDIGWARPDLRHRPGAPPGRIRDRCGRPRLALQGRLAVLSGLLAYRRGQA